MLGAFFGVAFILGPAIGGIISAGDPWRVVKVGLFIVKSWFLFAQVVLLADSCRPLSNVATQTALGVYLFNLFLLTFLPEPT